MSLSSWFIRHPVGTSLLMAALLVAGIAAYPQLPVAPLPEVEFPTIQVTTSLPGASPETIASSVTQPLERQLGQISGLAQMTSVSTLGNSAITLQFDLDRPIDGAAEDVITAINAAAGQLPTGLPAPPTYRKVNPADAPIMVLAVSSATLPIITVDDYAENVLVQRLSQVPGVSQVNVLGQQKPSVRVQVDPERIAAMGLSLEDVRGALVQTTTNGPKGTVQGPLRSFTITDNDQILAAEPWNDQVIAYRNQAPVRISDIGLAVAAAENSELAAWADERPAILLPVYKQPGANVIATVDAIKAMLPQLEASMPRAVDVRILSDRTGTIRASIDDVQRTLIITVVLVVAVIFAFLRSLRATVIPGLAVPLAIIASFAVMLLCGFSLDNLSLMGLSIAVGFVVDDAVVMLENIDRHMEGGASPLDAALKGASEIGFTILSISLSLMAVFIPLLFMGGIVGRLFREFAVTVTATIAISAVVSLTLTPTLCALFLKAKRPGAEGRFFRASERFFEAMLRFYAGVLDWALGHQRIVLGIFLATLAATGAAFVAIPKGFFPLQDTGLILGVSQAAEDISFADMKDRQLALARVVAADPDVASIGMAVGATPGQTVNSARMFITLKPRDQRQASASEIIRRLQPKLLAVQGIRLTMQSVQDVTVGGRASAAQYQYTLQDGDSAELYAFAPRLLDALRKLPELTEVASDQQDAGASLSLTIDRSQAARFGISPTAIDNVLDDAFGQRQVTQYFTELNSYHVILEVTPAIQNSPAVLDRIYVPSPTTGKQVPLSVLARWTSAKTSTLAINHQSQLPSVTLSFNTAPGVALSDAVAAIGRAEAGLGLPATIQTSFQGNAAAFQSSLASEPLLVLAALAVIYVILGVLYESTIHPLTILSTLPSAGLGALLMLWAFGFDFSVIGLIGVILLIGIVKKNGIMIVDFALAGEKERGLSPEAAIREACLMRFRPIMMTTMAALLGGVPLMLGSGTGSELRQPLGYAIVGGLVASQILTLVTTPVVFLTLDRFVKRLKALRSNAEAPAQPS